MDNENNNGNNKRYINKNKETFARNSADKLKKLGKEGNIVITNKRRFAAFLLAAELGIVGIGVGIANLHDKFNEAKNTKQAIEIASEYENYIKMEKNSIPQLENKESEVRKENLKELEGLEKAVQTYLKLQYKNDRTIVENEEYLEACKIICESKDLVIDTYTDVIKSKVAKAYKIGNLNDIKVKDYVKTDRIDGSVHNPNIHIKNDGIDVELTTKEMSSKLEQEIIKARELIDVEYLPENTEVKDLPTEEIVKVYESAVKLNNDYDVELNDNTGKLKLVELTKEAEIKEER